MLHQAVRRRKLLDMQQYTASRYGGEPSDWLRAGGSHTPQATMHERVTRPVVRLMMALGPLAVCISSQLVRACRWQEASLSSKACCTLQQQVCVRVSSGALRAQAEPSQLTASQLCQPPKGVKRRALSRPASLAAAALVALLCAALLLPAAAVLALASSAGTSSCCCDVTCTPDDWSDTSPGNSRVLPAELLSTRQSKGGWPKQV